MVEYRGRTTTPAEAAAAVALLQRYRQRGAASGIERMRWLCAAMGDPQTSLRAVHITGTNGKGSTSRLVDALLRGLGLRTGRFTSPHLERINERWAIDDEPIDDADLIGYIRRLAPVFDRASSEFGEPVTRFDALTAIALDLFRARGVDAAVIEVGYGGANDDTNVVDGKVAVLTSVGLDHTEYLGPTVRHVATEKAGIVKAGATAILGPAPPEAEAIVAARCADVGAAFWRVGAEVRLARVSQAADGRHVTVVTPGGRYDIAVPFRGAHQAANAACALAATEAFVGGPLDAAVVGRAWLKVDNPARFEVLEGAPTVILDVADNPSAADALATAVAQEYPGSAAAFVVGLRPEKDAAGVLAEFRRVCDVIVLTQAPDDAPHADAAALADAARMLGFGTVLIERRPAQAVARAVKLVGADGLVVCAGSHYWIGTVAAELRRRS